MHTKNSQVLIAIGGGESNEITDDSLRITEKFLKLAQPTEKAKIIVMTVATDDPKNAGERYTKLFGCLKFKDFEVMNIADRAESFDRTVFEKIESASGLYFTGGDQLHITALMGGTPLHELILEKFRAGMVVAGTSAGAMMMSSATLVSGETNCAPRLDSVEVAPGMNLLPDTIIDTHFSQRGRHGRLLSAVAHNPQTLGIGIDERTAAVIHKNKFEVIGEGAVTVIDVGKSQHSNLPYLKKSDSIAIFGVNINVLPKGYKYDLDKREPCSPPLRQIIKQGKH